MRLEALENNTIVTNLCSVRISTFAMIWMNLWLAAASYQHALHQHLPKARHSLKFLVLAEHAKFKCKGNQLYCNGPHTPLSAIAIMTKMYESSEAWKVSRYGSQV